MDDSTLDGLGELLASHNIKPSEVEKVLKVEPPQADEKATTKDIRERERELEAYDRMSKALKTGLLGIQTAKKGIERLEDQVSHSDSAPRDSPKAHISHTSCSVCAAHQPTTTTAAYIHVPVPRLYTREPRFRWTTLGLVLLLLSLWLTAESTMCSLYCKPDICEAGQDCSWTPDDPFFGYAIPVKIDQWITGGRGRSLVRSLGEEVDDLLADAWDFITGRDIATIDTRFLNHDQKRQHRRRLMKKGLIKPWKSPPEQQTKLDAWRATREARDRARDAREMGYDIGDGLGDESMAADEKVSRR